MMKPPAPADAPAALHAAIARCRGGPSGVRVVSSRSAEGTDAAAAAPCRQRAAVSSRAEPATFALGESWLLLLYTDGLVEGSASPGSVDRLGTAGLMSELAALLAAGTSAAELGAALVQRAQHLHGGPLSDDIAVVAVGSCDWWQP